MVGLVCGAGRSGPDRPTLGELLCGLGGGFLGFALGFGFVVGTGSDRFAAGGVEVGEDGGEALAGGFGGGVGGVGRDGGFDEGGVFHGEELPFLVHLPAVVVGVLSRGKVDDRIQVCGLG